MRKSSSLFAIPSGLRGFRRSSRRWVVAIAIHSKDTLVCPEAAILGVKTVLDTLYKHLKYLNHWVVMVMKEMADAEIGAEGPPLCIIGDGTLV